MMLQATPGPRHFLQGVSRYGLWQERGHSTAIDLADREEVCKEVAGRLSKAGHLANTVQLEAVLSTIWQGAGNKYAEFVDLVLCRQGAARPEPESGHAQQGLVFVSASSFLQRDFAGVEHLLWTRVQQTRRCAGSDGPTVAQQGRALSLEPATMVQQENVDPNTAAGSSSAGEKLK